MRTASARAPLPGARRARRAPPRPKQRLRPCAAKTPRRGSQTGVQVAPRAPSAATLRALRAVRARQRPHCRAAQSRRAAAAYSRRPRSRQTPRGQNVRRGIGSGIKSRAKHVRARRAAKGRGAGRSRRPLAPSQRPLKGGASRAQRASQGGKRCWHSGEAAGAASAANYRRDAGDRVRDARAVPQIYATYPDFIHLFFRSKLFEANNSGRDYSGCASSDPPPSLATRQTAAAPP